MQNRSCPQGARGPQLGRPRQGGTAREHDAACVPSRCLRRVARLGRRSCRCTRRSAPPPEHRSGTRSLPVLYLAIARLVTSSRCVRYGTSAAGCSSVERLRVCSRCSQAAKPSASPRLSPYRATMAPSSSSNVTAVRVLGPDAGRHDLQQVKVVIEGHQVRSQPDFDRSALGFDPEYASRIPRRRRRSVLNA